MLHRSRAGARKSRHGHGVVGAQGFGRAGRERDGALVTHRAVLLENTFRHIEELHLRIVGIAHDAAGKKFARAMHSRKRVGQHSTRRRLGEGQSLFLRPKKITDDFGQRVVPVAHHVFAEQGTAFTSDGFELLVVEATAGGTDAAVNRTLVRAKRDTQGVTIVIEDWLQARLEHRFADPHRPELHIRLAIEQQSALDEARHDLLEKHRVQLIRRTREHHEHFAVLLDPETGCGAVTVHHDLAAFEPVSLLEVVIRHLPTEAAEAVRDRLHNAFIAHEFLSEHRSDGLARTVVAGRPEPAGGDDHVGPRPALAKLSDDHLRLVGDGDIAPQHHAPTPELRADEREVAVGREPEQ